MAGKKKKPASNPARGFATTSIASKPKVEKEKPSESPADSETVNSTKGNSTPVSAPQANGKPGPGPQPGQQANPAEKELHELSPEELEKRLEEAELQSLVDKYYSKAQRDATRHVQKMQTDCRLLRGSAMPVSTRGLLNEQLVDAILAMAKQDVENGRSASLGQPEKRPLKEDEAIAHLWALRRTLEGLGFSTASISGATKHVLRYPPPFDVDVLVWGLNETLDWLVLNSPLDDLPIYDSATGKLRLDKVEEELPESLLAPSEADPAGKKAAANGASAIAAEQDVISTADLKDDIEVSDLEDDLAPDEMLSVWLATKSSLYERRPDLADPQSGGKSRKKQPSKEPPKPVTPGIKKLQQKLSRIESDVLFDRYDAEEQWLVRRNEIAQHVADRRRAEIASQPAETISDKNDAHTVESTTASTEQGPDQAEDDEIGGLFGDALLDQAEAEAAEHSERVVADTLNVTIRMFETSKGKGVSPRQILTETCKARDPGAKLSWKKISIADWSNRHSVTIEWSKPQSGEISVPLEQIDIQSHPRRFELVMKHIACPDSSQSEAYASTVALFQIFSTSQKEERVYLKLPPVWRDLWQELTELRRDKSDFEAREVVRELRDLVRSQIEEDEDEDVIHTKNFEARYERSRSRAPEKAENGESMGKETKTEAAIRQIWIDKASSPSYQSMLQDRRKLPMTLFREQAVDTVRNNQITILCGETGCGKSTQMPSFILEDQLSAGKPCKIYCTEPRRISAITLAQRVSQELGEPRNAVGTPRSLVGYAIRLESNVSAATRLVYATTGIVLRMLESPDGFSDITHVVIDEVHERSIETDFLLIILRKLTVQRPDLKVILMSATVDSERFANYFQGAPVLNVPGRTFPVETRFLEDAIEVTGHKLDDDAAAADSDDVDDLGDMNTSDKGKEQSELLQGYSKSTQMTLSKFNEYRIDYTLITKLITQIVTNPVFQPYSKAILVFLPGLAEIRQLSSILYSTHVHQMYDIHTLHSSIASEDQQAAFLLPAQGRGKIVLSTNIAETGVTIPDITAVIDTGKHKEMRFDERRQVSRLLESFISRANAKQRRGRAGRVQNGLCFHLFTRHRHDHIMAGQQTPEMLRLSLQDLIMRVKITGLGDISAALSAALDPPAPKNIRRAIDQLIEVGALTSKEELTSLGSQLSKLPLDPYLGKLVLLSALHSALDPALTIAAILTSKSPFVAPVDTRKLADNARVAFKKADSDLLTEYNAYLAWKRTCIDSPTSEHQFCRRNCLSQQTLTNIEDLKTQLLSALRDTGLVPSKPEPPTTAPRSRKFVTVPPALNRHAHLASPVLPALLSWSLYPKILSKDPASKYAYRALGTNQSIALHPTCLARLSPPTNPASLALVSYYSILQSGGGKYNASGCTPVHPLLLLLGPAGDARFDAVSGAVILDGARLRVVFGESAKGLREARQVWRTLTAVKYLRWRVVEVVERRWKGKTVGASGQKWWDMWEMVVASWESKIKEAS